MKKTIFLTAALAFSACLSHATTLTVGSPNYNNMSGYKLSPSFGTSVNFDSLVQYTALAANAFATVGVQSMTSNNSADPLYVYPYSSQSAPNYVSTQDGFGSLTITLTSPASIIGIGILESDGDADTLQALGVNGNVLGSYSVTVPSAGNTPFNAYYVISDTTSDIKSLVISSAAGNFGVDDLQFAPEPLNVALIGGGLLGLLALARLRKSKADAHA